jgi:MFS family permease
VVVSGTGNGAAIVCNALLVQRGAPDRLRGRAFTVLMSSSVTVLALGMVLAGRLTDAFGPRWIWGAAALLSAVASIVGFLLARRAAVATPGLAEPAELHTPPEVEAPVQAQERAI